jgi:hypothetical protein
VTTDQQCTRSHPHEEMSVECQLRTEIVRLKAAVRNARLTWAMVCQCPCDACDTFYEALKLTSGDVGGSSG